MRTSVRAAAALALLFLAAPAAEAQSTISLLPQSASRWDLTLAAGRQGVNRDEIAPDWGRWYDAGQVTFSAGYYLTPHVKLEADVSRSGTGRMYLPEVPSPGQAWNYSRSREHRFTTTGASGAIQYQFFENQWFHPFAGAGLEFLHERQDADPLPSTVEFRGPSGIFVPAAPALPSLRTSRSTVRPFASTGFKVYVSRHAFFRTDVHVALSGRGAETATWRAGVGVDF